MQDANVFEVHVKKSALKNSKQDNLPSGLNDIPKAILSVVETLYFHPHFHAFRIRHVDNPIYKTVNLLSIEVKPLWGLMNFDEEGNGIFLSPKC